MKAPKSIVKFAFHNKRGWSNMPRPGPRKIEKPKNPIKTFKKIFTFVGKYKWQLLVVVLATIGAVGANLGGTYLMQGALSIIENFDVTKATLDETLLLLGGQVGIIIAVYLVGIVCSVLSSRLVLNIQTGTLRAFREAMFEKMEKLPILVPMAKSWLAIPPILMLSVR